MTYRQGDPAWSKLEIAPASPGGKPRNLGRIGCLITAIAEAERRFGGALTPADVLAKGLAKKTFLGANAILDQLASSCGLYAPRSDRVYLTSGEDAMRARVREALAAGGFVIVHVDNVQDAVDEGRHFVLGFALRASGPEGSRPKEWIDYADPATGTESLLPFETLKGPAPYGGRNYRAISVAPIYRAPLPQP